jgi:hypothetical protein
MAPANSGGNAPGVIEKPGMGGIMLFIVKL